MMIRSPNTAHGRGRPVAPPAWRVGLTQLEWVQVGGNTLSDVDPTANPAINPNYPGTAPWAQLGPQSDLTTAWSGAAWDEANQRMWFVGGGHIAYNGNEPYSIDYDIDTPLFTMRGYPTGAIQRPVDNTEARKVGDTNMMQDGRPFTTHTYNLLCVLGNGRLLQGGGGFAYDGNGTDPVEYDPLINDWDVSGGRYDYSGVPIGAQGGIEYDPVRNVCWSIAAQNISKYDCSTKSVSASFYDYTSNPIYGPVKRMPNFDLFAVFGGSANGFGTGKHVVLFDPASPGTTPVGINATTADWSRHGVAYDSRRNRFLAWNGGATITTLTPPATNPKINAWTYGSLTTSTVIVTPSAGNANGTYGRFQYSQKHDCCFAINLVTERTYVLPLS